MPAPQNEVVEFAARLLGVAPPEVIPLDRLSPAAPGFSAENRRVANGNAKSVLGCAPAFADYRAGLRALHATTGPIDVHSPTQSPPTKSDRKGKRVSVRVTLGGHRRIKNKTGKISQ